MIALSKGKRAQEEPVHKIPNVERFPPRCKMRMVFALDSFGFPWSAGFSRVEPSLERWAIITYAFAIILRQLTDGTPAGPVRWRCGLVNRLVSSCRDKVHSNEVVYVDLVS